MYMPVRCPEIAPPRSGKCWKTVWLSGMVSPTGTTDRFPSGGVVGIGHQRLVYGAGRASIACVDMAVSFESSGSR